MTGKALGIGHDDLIGRLAEGLAQGRDFGRGTAAPGGRVGLVGDEAELGRHAVAVDAEAPFRRGYQALHDAGNVGHIQACAVEGAIGDFGRQQFYDAPHAPLMHGVFALQNQGAGAHAQEGAVAAAVKGQGGFFHLVVGRGRACGQEACADPTHEIVAGHIVGADDDDPTAAPVANPVLGQGDGLGRAGAGRVDVGIRPPRADEFGELAVAHGQNPENKAPVKFVGVLLQLFPHLADAPLNFHEGIAVMHVPAQVFQHFEFPAQAIPGVEAFELIGHAIAAGEGAGENHAGLVAQGLGQKPAFRQVGALAGGAIGLDQGDACFV